MPVDAYQDLQNKGENGDQPSVDQLESSSAFQSRQLFVSAVYEKYGYAVICTAVHFYARHADAEERAENTAQEVFIQLLLQHDVAAIRNIWRWLLTTTKNLCLNAIAREKRFAIAKSKIAYLQAQPYQGIAAKEKEAEEDAALNEMEQALGEMEAVKQNVIYCRYYLGLSIQETADKLNISHGSVRGHLHTTLVALRSKFNNH